MTRRLPVPTLLALATAALVLAARPSDSLAEAIVADPTQPTYHLKNAGTSPVTTVDFDVLPPGTIVPPADGKSPLSIVKTSTGFDQGQYATFLSPAGTMFNGQPAQFLRLSFGTPGLAPGGEIDYQLNLSKAFTGNLQLQLPADAANSLVSTTTPGIPAAPPIIDPVQPLALVRTSTVTTPEPASVALWASLAGLGLLRARRRSRALVG